MQEAVTGHFFVFGAGLTIVGIRIDADAAAWNKDTCYLNILGIHEVDKVFHDDVDAILMETSVITETEKVEFEAFALYHSLVWKVVDAYLCEVGLSGNGTKSRELWAVEAYPIVVLRMLVLESLKYPWGVILRYFGFFA